MKKISLLLTFVFAMTTYAGFSQDKSPYRTFSNFVGQGLKLPEELKSDCDWLYAVIRVRTNVNNRIIKYEFLNDPPEAMKKNFGFLIGYQFPKTMAINKHPIVFQFELDNSEVCKPKAGDHIYSPREVIGIITSILLKVEKDDPKTIIIPQMTGNKYYKVQY